MASSTPIQPGAHWSEQWRILTYTGGDEDLTDADLSWTLETLEGTVILALNSDDNPASFGTFDGDGASSASGPYARVTLDDTQTTGLTVGRYRHQLTATLSTGVVIKSQVHPINVSEVL